MTENTSAPQENSNWHDQSSSFITSLGDEELILFVKKLSQQYKEQRKALQEQEQSTDADGEDHMNSTEIDTEEDLEDFSEKPLAEDAQEDAPDEASVLPSSPVLLSSAKSASHKASTSDVLGSINMAQDHKKTNSSPPTDEDEEESSGLLFGDYETYFKEKKLKQLAADEEYRAWDEERRRKQGNGLTYPPIFRGCIVYVNGRTDPDITQLHKLIVLYGGAFLHYLGAKGNATHIIASNLTPKKHIEFRNYKVVLPEWVTRSIELKKLLPWYEFQLINNDHGQKKLNLHRVEQPLPVKNNTVDFDSSANARAALLLPPTDIQVSSEPDIEEERGALTAKHPEFLKYFFKKSRLHHLSTWKLDLKYEFLQKALLKMKSLQKTLSSPYRSGTRIIFHIDFDCFFATVSTLNTPGIDIHKVPIAVSHGGGSADVASCNYILRSFGIRNGMWMRNAKKLCPALICLDYNFPEYERISRIFYDIMINLDCDSVLPVSVDEVLLDVTSLVEHRSAGSVNELAQGLKQQVYDATRCTVSVGASSNVLLAKLALRKSKPNGVFYLDGGSPSEVTKFLDDVHIRDLPGVGSSISSKLEQKFNRKNIKVDFLRKIDQQQLISIFGIKTGKKLYDYARGIDDTDINIANNPSDYTRKSVSIDINWGIRLDNIEQVDLFLLSCSKEVNSRLLKISMKGSTLTLKLGRRAPHAPIEPSKYLGMGECDFFSKSSRLGLATREVGLIYSECKALYRTLNIPPLELRGVSVQISNLIEDDAASRQQVDQSKLPFSKINQSQFLKHAYQDTNERNASPITIDSSPVVAKRKQPQMLRQPQEPISVEGSSSQYEIPSDVDSSLIKVLPNKVQDAIKYKKQARSPSPTAAEALPSDSKIDWEVFRALPLDLQNELKLELKSREIPILQKSSPPAVVTPKHSPSKRISPIKSHLQPIFAKNPQDGPQVIRVLSPSKLSPRKRLKRASKSPSPIVNLNQLDIDPVVLNELPSSVRRDLEQDLRRENQRRYLVEDSEEHRQLESEILKDLEKLDGIRSIKLTEGLVDEMSNDRTRRPLFHKQRSFKKIKALLVDWIVRTILVGPNEGDLVMFMDFITELWPLSIGDCINYLRVINSSISVEASLLGDVDQESAGVVKWRNLLHILKELVDDRCQELHMTYEL